MKNKIRTISERLSEAAKNTFVGRQNEISVLSNAIEAAELPFIVAFIRGPGGIGKSRLIQAALNNISPAVNRYVLDCREIEPTPQGFQIALGAALEMQESELDFRSVVGRLVETEQRTVLALDAYENFGLMDTWLRQDFLPSLSENVFTIIASREAPNPGWLTSPGWQSLFKEIELRELSADDSQKMLAFHNLTLSQIDRIKNFARGYPLVLEIAAAAIHNQPDLEITEGPPPKVLQQLTQTILAGLPSETMVAVEASSIVRRVTEPSLRALLDASSVKEICDPESHQIYRKRAYSYLSKESQRAVARNLWQYTADLLFMIENPIARSAFFPEGATNLRVEPATSSDAEEIREILKAKEPLESARQIKRWWDTHPETFNFVKTREGKYEAFYILFEPDNVDRSLLEEDPFTSLWLKHLIDSPIANAERVLFCRRWVDRTTGEMPSPAVSACFLDIKRVYMELRPSLRRIYFPVINLSTFEPILSPLGFTAPQMASVTLGGITYHTLMNDFGPSSIDGWLANLIGAELGVDIATIQGRILVIVLFTDIVSSTKKAITLGDSEWRKLIDCHHALVRKELARFQGREIDTAGDGFFATFGKPANAIKCACSISNSVRELGIEIRAGLHLGECEVTDDAVRGITVHIGARLADKAEGGEVLVSSTLKDAVAGSGIRFADRGSHMLKGIPGEWNLFAVKEVSSR
jgi:class 3 adenylate cyclase